tara:strand:- start:9065 stop:10498 length:1434 start_codon:yes stop_codon:yes gene_type:complete
VQFVVLFGPQAGAHVTLHSGDYVVGCGEEDDVVVMGRGVANAHFRFAIDEAAGRLKVLKCEKTVFSEGAHALSENDEIALPQKFWIGDVVIGIGGLETRWDEPKFEESPHAVDRSVVSDDANKPSDNGAEALEGGAGDKTSLLGQGGLTDDATGATGEADAATDEAVAISDDGRKRKSSRSVMLIPIVVTTVAVIGGLLMVFIAGDDESIATPAPGQVMVPGQEEFSEITTLLAGISEVSDLKATLIDGIPHVAGYAPTTQTVEMISTAVYGIAPEARIDVIADSELEKRAASVLSGRGVKVDKVEDGVVYVSSVVSDPGAKEQLVAFVQEEVVGAAGVDAEKIYEIRELIDVFGDQLKRQGISQISLRNLRDEIIVSGRLEWSKLNDWEDLLAQWTDEYGLNFRDARPVVLDGDNMPFELVAAVGGDNGFLLLSGQEKVHIGGEVAPGFTLKSVTDGALVLQRHDSEYMIDIRETE